MVETPPSHPLFDSAPGRSGGVTTDPADRFGLPADDRERELLDTLRDRLGPRMERNRIAFRPELLIRTYVGDFGIRPYGGTFWHSPDIWVAPGDPASTPAVPANPGGSPVVGQPHTLYAHVWNLGLAPLIGATVEFLVFNPSIAFAGQAPLFRATARVDLASRTSAAECHKLVKCPVAWVPALVNGGHECLIVRASGVGDPLAPDHLEPAVDRKVAQRNIMVLPWGADVAPLLGQLGGTLPRGARLTFWLVGAGAQPIVDLVAPGRRATRAEDVQIGEPGRAPAPGRGTATVVHVQGRRDDEIVGGYTLVFVDK
ncbi:hypothetical protein AB0J86_18975 [Micromonospora sp. NPDC049559]|uniref:hypothetical protein n=1 Tax=Micromonospora sp. NPDC049559 TaxID=3155923 RepID=UPI00341D2853